MWHLEGRGCSKFSMPWVVMPLWDQRWRKSSKEHAPVGWGLAEVGSCQGWLGLVALTLVSEQSCTHCEKYK